MLQAAQLILLDGVPTHQIAAGTAVMVRQWAFVLSTDCHLANPGCGRHQGEFRVERLVVLAIWAAGLRGQP